MQRSFGFVLRGYFPGPVDGKTALSEMAAVQWDQRESNARTKLEPKDHTYKDQRSVPL